MAIDFCQQYPEMHPFEGTKYQETRKKGCLLLVIGESHYLPENSSVHLDASNWYRSDSSRLSDTERGWINTREVIQEGLETDFKNKSYVIFKNSAETINQYGPHFSDAKNVFDYIVFYNFFLRPARKGMSLKEILQDIDVEVANEYFSDMLRKYSPNGVLFLSRFAADCCQNLPRHIPVAATPHPGCVWWNRKSSQYGDRYGREIVQDVAAKLPWERL